MLSPSWPSASNRMTPINLKLARLIDGIFSYFASNGRLFPRMLRQSTEIIIAVLIYYIVVNILVVPRSALCPASLCAPRVHLVFIAQVVDVIIDLVDGVKGGLLLLTLLIWYLYYRFLLLLGLSNHTVAYRTKFSRINRTIAQHAPTLLYRIGPTLLLVDLLRRFIVDYAIVNAYCSLWLLLLHHIRSALIVVHAWLLNIKLPIPGHPRIQLLTTGLVLFGLLAHIHAHTAASLRILHLILIITLGFLIQQLGKTILLLRTIVLLEVDVAFEHWFILDDVGTLLREHLVEWSGRSLVSQWSV